MISGPAKSTDDIGSLRSLVIICLFILSGVVLWMIHDDPGLLKEGAFMLLVGMIVGQGGQGAATAWLFGGTQTGAAVMKSNAEAIQSASPTSAPAPGTTTTTTTPPAP